MESTQDFIQDMGDKLRNVHVSGQTESSNHYLTYLSKNKEAIENVLGTGINVSRISEGVSEGYMSQNISEILFRELEFMRSPETMAGANNTI